MSDSRCLLGWGGQVIDDCQWRAHPPSQVSSMCPSIWNFIARYSPPPPGEAVHQLVGGNCRARWGQSGLLTDPMVRGALVTFTPEKEITRPSPGQQLRKVVNFVEFCWIYLNSLGFSWIVFFEKHVTNQWTGGPTDQQTNEQRFLNSCFSQLKSSFKSNYESRLAPFITYPGTTSFLILRMVGAGDVRHFCLERIYKWMLPTWR